MKKTLLSGKDWKKPEEKVVMSIGDALHILNEASPLVSGTQVGAHPKLEKLADVIGYDLKKVN